MELIHKDNRDGYVYDVVIKQFDTNFWKQTAGTSTVSSNKLRNNAAALASYLQHEFADVEFGLNVPADPTSGDSRQWGLKAPASSNFGAAYFDITDAVFSCKVVSNDGTAYSTTCTWVTGWHGAEVAYRIIWEPDRIQFLVGTVSGGVVTYSVLATFDSLNHPHGMPLIALPLRIVNGNSDNMDLGYVAVRRAAGIV